MTMLEKACVPIQRKCAWWSSLRKKALSFAQQDRVDQHLIRKSMLENDDLR